MKKIAAAGIMAIWILVGTGCARQEPGVYPVQPQPVQQATFRLPLKEQLEGELFLLQKNGRALVLNGTHVVWESRDLSVCLVEDLKTQDPGGFAVEEADGWMLYDAGGEPVCSCGGKKPRALLGQFVLLQNGEAYPAEDKAQPFLEENGWMDTTGGESLWQGCTGAVKSGEGYILNFGQGNAPVRVDDRLHVLEQYQGYTTAEPAPLPGAVLLSRWEKGTLHRYLDGERYKDETGRTLPFLHMVGEDKGLFENPEGGFVLVRLEDGEILEKTQTRNYRVCTGALKLWQEENTGWHLEQEGREETGVLAGVWNGGCYLWKGGGQPLMLWDKNGALQKKIETSAMEQVQIQTLGQNLLAVCYRGGNGAEGGLQLYRPGGMTCALAGEPPVNWVLTPDGWAAAEYANGTARLFAADGSGGSRIYPALHPTHMAGVLTAEQGENWGLMDYNGNWIWQGPINPEQ